MRNRTDYINFSKCAALYCRVKKDIVLSYNESLDGQQKILEDYCRKENIEVVACFREVYSGKPFAGLEFQKFKAMITSPNSRVNLLLVTEWHRFTRDLAAGLNMVEFLRNNGVCVRAALTQDPRWESFNYFTYIFREFGWIFNPQ